MKRFPITDIRNFCIIAHIDHGKSTLADRILEKTKAVHGRDMREQVLDDMDLERERGITIKAHPVSMEYTAKNGKTYQFNLIDTPGHVDFTYEVSRSLSACEGAILVVDASQGLQAQSLANVYLALERGLEIIPVINKIDLPSADPEGARREIEEVLAIEAHDAVLCSAKSGIGIDELMEAIVHKVPCPKPVEEERLRALVFDSQYDSYRGVLSYIRVMSGQLRRGDKIRFMATGREFEVLDLGIFSPKEKPTDALYEGQVGCLSAGMKNIREIKVGDTITNARNPALEPLEGFKEIQPVVFAGIYPIDSGDFETLRDAVNKLQLNDSALHAEQESSHTLGFGMRCGFLGLLHLEIIFERLQREFDLDIITTSPSVVYKVYLSNQTCVEVSNPAHYPDPAQIDYIEEPWAKSHIFVPGEYMGAVMNLGMDKRGSLVKTETLQHERIMMTYQFPLTEIITDFSDRLKSITRGYASFDYELDSYIKSDIIKLEIRVNEEPVDAFSCLVHRSKAERKGRLLCEKLSEVIPSQLFKVPVQAAIGGKVVARETIRALSKDVTAKCYGGDITRKRKLWEKQKKGKKRMKEIGKVSIPQSAFMEVLKLQDD
jgi:GTP-binding protein LepA